MISRVFLWSSGTGSMLGHESALLSILLSALQCLIRWGMFREGVWLWSCTFPWSDRHGRTRGPQPHRIRGHTVVSSSRNPSGLSQVRLDLQNLFYLPSSLWWIFCVITFVSHLYCITWWHHDMEIYTFHITGPMWGEPLVTSRFPWQKASNSELWCFLCCYPEQTVEQTITICQWFETLWCSYDITLMISLCPLLFPDTQRV